jgi:hypothetical protein
LDFTARSLFLRSVPTLELLFAVYGFVHIVKRLVINQPMALVLPGEALDQIVLVLKNTAVEIVGHPMYKTRDLLAIIYTL